MKKKEITKSRKASKKSSKMKEKSKRNPIKINDKILKEGMVISGEIPDLKDGMVIQGYNTLTALKKME